MINLDSLFEIIDKAVREGPKKHLKNGPQNKRDELRTDYEDLRSTPMRGKEAKGDVVTISKCFRNHYGVNKIQFLEFKRHNSTSKQNRK